MTTQPAPQFVQSARLFNKTDLPIRLVVEDEPIILALPPGEEFKITLSGPTEGMIEIAFYKNSVELWPWVGSTISVVHKGVELAGPYFTNTKHFSPPNKPSVD